VSAVNLHSIINLFRNGWNDLSPRQYVVKKDNVSRRSGIDPQIHLHLISSYVPIDYSLHLLFEQVAALQLPHFLPVIKKV